MGSQRVIHYLMTEQQQMYIRASLVAQQSESACNAGDMGSIPGSGRSLGGGHQPSPVFLLGESHGQRSPASYSPQGCRESDMTKTNEQSHTYIISYICILIYIYIYNLSSLIRNTCIILQLPWVRRLGLAGFSAQALTRLCQDVR